MNAKLTWNKLKNNTYYRDGSFRDLYILNTDRTDWKKWIEYVNQNYIIKWYNGKTGREENQVDYEVINEYWNGNYNLCSTANVFIDKIQINCHFFCDFEIENDIEPSEFNSIDDHKKLMKYMTDLSEILGKEIILTPENEQEIVLIRVNKLV